ncbi:elongation factor P [Candidatus Poriferisodalis sp.]|uniref:elongation factor P n=1 Tax=Candidatus Poriferisodalis sp. TaxID=3101277 RepID=UPI003B010945
MAISTADFRNGMTLELADGLFQLAEFQHVKPGKGGAFVRTTLRNVRTGATLERTFRAGERMERAVIDHRDMQYLYADGETLVFMDTDTYEQLPVSRTAAAGATSFLVEGETATVVRHGDEVLGVELPASVVLEVADTDPGVQGDRVSGARKPATMSTGLVIQVPLFIEAGERLKVDTRNGDYIERARS